MKSPIIYTRDPGELSGYESVPYGDGCFWYDPKRKSHQDALDLMHLYEDGEVEKVMQRCDFEPVPWWDGDLVKLMEEKASGLLLSKN